ncbi:MAG: hypothetical protein IJB86_06990 [Clostridia bacterium]|nr:hypothetical protein [Clostridia bacterium]
MLYNMFEEVDGYYVFKGDGTKTPSDAMQDKKQQKNGMSGKVSDIIIKSMFKLLLSGAFMYASMVFMTDNGGVSAVRILAAILIFLISATVFTAEFKVMCTKLVKRQKADTIPESKSAKFAP